jgi:hypothetical protein
MKRATPNIILTLKVISGFITMQKSRPRHRCEHYKARLDAPSPLCQEVATNILFACILIVVIIPFGYALDRWVSRQIEKSFNHILGYEPLEDWSR